MDNTLAVNENYETQYCFPFYNFSCLRAVWTNGENIMMYIFFASVSVLTVFLNLLVIISISHFKQLHTPTNLLILSLAVSDLIVGFFVMPLESIRLIENCWYFGDVFCSIYPLILYVVVSASLGNLVFISIDRYIAVSNPLHYTSFVTNGKTLICIFICWSCSLFYSVSILFNHLFYPETHGTCYGECVLIISFTWVVIDLFVSLIAPCSVVCSLYMRIFCIARRQANVIKSVKVNLKSEDEVVASKSERKAAKTLGIVVAIYMLCWVPYYISILAEGSISSASFYSSFFSGVMNMNSCMNPIIYALFYPWFRVSVKHTLTLKIFEPSSSYISLLH
ncbi:trace amine-associated receptor 13c-like [Chanos chanos]|uniref:Trace amine-associated receptor 13c-like n=1 Tax=Chanos chanos TaxID=29144 RepID=A0A6J2WUW9_CHACN|nr:trace amine-associated receptor 13c-like [Chanos chanos]